MIDQSDNQNKNLVLSLNDEELASWVKSRLQGDDKYFPIYIGGEPDLSGFLDDAYKYIKIDKFRESFLRIIVGKTKKND